MLVSVEEQLSGEDSRELQIQVSEKASLNVHGMLPSTTLSLILFLFCFCFYSSFFLLSLSPLRCFGKTVPSFVNLIAPSVSLGSVLSLAPALARCTESSVR